MDQTLEQILETKRLGDDPAYKSWTFSHLTRTNFDVEVVPLVGYLEDLRPRESVDPQPVSVDEQATCTDAQHDLHTLRILQTTHTHQNISLTVLLW